MVEYDKMRDPDCSLVISIEGYRSRDITDEFMGEIAWNVIKSMMEYAESDVQGITLWSPGMVKWGDSRVEFDLFIQNYPTVKDKQIDEMHNNVGGVAGFSIEEVRVTTGGGINDSWYWFEGYDDTCKMG